MERSIREDMREMEQSIREDMREMEQSIREEMRLMEERLLDRIITIERRLDVLEDRIVIRLTKVMVILFSVASALITLGFKFL